MGTLDATGRLLRAAAREIQSRLVAGGGAAAAAAGGVLQHLLTLFVLWIGLLLEQ